MAYDCTVLPFASLFSAAAIFLALTTSVIYTFIFLYCGVLIALLNPLGEDLNIKLTHGYVVTHGYHSWVNPVC